MHMIVLDVIYNYTMKMMLMMRIRLRYISCWQGVMKVQSSRDFSRRPNTSEWTKHLTAPPSGPSWINTSEYPSQPNANKLGNSGYFRPAHQSGPAQLDTLGFTQNLWTVWNSVSKCSVASQNRLWSAQPISVWKHQP